MQVLVDADACPVVVKEMLYRAAQRVEVCVTLVANKYLRTPPAARDARLKRASLVRDNRSLAVGSQPQLQIQLVATSRTSTYPRTSRTNYPDTVPRQAALNNKKPRALAGRGFKPPGADGSAPG